MTIASEHEAMISRRVYPSDGRGFVLEEAWDLHHPCCPFVVSPCNAAPDSGVQKDICIRYVILSEVEYRGYFGTEGAPEFDRRSPPDAVPSA